MVHIYKYIYTKILEVNLFAFAYRLFHRDLSIINRAYCLNISINIIVKFNKVEIKHSFILASAMPPLVV